MKMKAILLLIIFFAIVGQLLSQDPNSSLQYSVPSMLAPTMVGQVDGMLKASASHRYLRVLDDANYNTSWFAVDIPFETNIAKGGMGILAGTDYAKGMNTTHFMLGGAYEVPLGVKVRYHHLRAGFQVGFVNRKLVRPDLYFEDQFNGFGFSGQTQEQFQGLSKGYFDLAMGVMWYRTQKIKGNPEFNPWFSASIHHITRPNVRFFNEPAERLSYRYSFIAGGKLRTRTPFDANINLSYFLQNNSHLFSLGLFGRYVFYERKVWFDEENGDVFAGFMLRPYRSIVYMVGAGLKKNYYFAVGYDMLVAKERIVNGNFGGIQFMFVYILGGHKYDKPFLPYPVF